MKMWKDKAGPCMQFLHFAFALGAFFAPLLAKPFLSEEVGDTDTANSDQEDSNSLLFAWAYWIAASIFVPPLLAFMYYAIKFELVPRFRKEPSTQTTASLDEDQEVQKEDSEVLKNREQNEKSDLMEKGCCYRFLLISLTFLFMFFYVGIEVAFGTFIFTIAVKGELQFSKQKAALLASVF